MAINYVREGDSLQYTNTGSAISSGDEVVMNDVLGVALVDIAASTGTGEVAIEGVFTLTKVAGTAAAVGETMHWDASGGGLINTITPASGDISNACICVEAAASAATTVNVKLTPGTGTGA